MGAKLKTFPILAILFLGIPILEIYLLIQVGSSVGVILTMFLVVLTAVLGAFLLRQQGLSTLTRFQQNMGSGKLPAQELLEGVILLVGGALLMTPGFFTDAVGFLCLFPLSRQAIAFWLMRRSKDKIKAKMYTSFDPNAASQKTKRPDDSNVYEGEYTKKQDDRINRW